MRAVRCVLLICVQLSSLLGGCGARTDLAVDEVASDGGVDGGAPDAGTDAGTDSGADSGSDAGTDAGPPPPACVEVPYDGGIRDALISFEARIVAADVAFLVDNTGSMGPLIEEIEDTLQTRLIPGLLAQVPDVQMAVAIYRDFGFAPYGMAGDEPFELFQRSTADREALQTAAERMHPRGGGDLPESAVEALYQLATGEGLGDWIAPTGCEGAVGAACMRADAVPMIVLFTDAPFQNGPSWPGSYRHIRPPPHTYDETVTALNARGFRVIGMHTGGFMSERTRNDLTAIATDTGAVDGAGQPIVLDLDSSGGRPLVGRVVDAVRALVGETTLDVDAFIEDVPGDAVDATRFVRRVIAARAEPRDGATRVGDRYEDVRPGTRVVFRVELENDFLEPPPSAARYPLRVVLREGGVTPLVDRILEVVVPGDGGGGC